MKGKVASISFSKLSVLLCLMLAMIWRFNYHTNNEQNGYNATTWDALGYYMYLPSTLIYQDVNQLDWFPEIDKKYQVSGGELYQASLQEDSTYVFKYLGGTAIMQLPFFLIGHSVAHLSSAPADGFSAPYQYSIMWGAVFWFFVGLWFLRKVMLAYFTERTTSITIILVVGASNLLQYVSIDGAMSHAFIFPMYSLLLWWTHKWHQNPQLKYAFLIGLVIGLATISRPTEIIMVFIPLLWKLNSDFPINKWNYLKEHPKQLFFLLTGGIVGILPQLIYWKVASGDWVYNVGSKWFFLDPWWRVLIGFEKGWFIYTPIALFMVGGLFFISRKPFQKSVITFCLLNIWIIISWSDWTYGASYSTRAFTQSYPVFALALGGLIGQLHWKKWKYLILFIGGYFIINNQFQLWQYNAGIIHYNDMNESYYKAVYWDPSPTSLEYSLLDEGDRMPDRLSNELITRKDTVIYNKPLDNWESIILFNEYEPEYTWISHLADLTADNGIRQGEFVITSFAADTVLESKTFRLSLPFVEDHKMNRYHHQYRVPEECERIELKLQCFGTMMINELDSKIKVITSTPYQ